MAQPQPYLQVYNYQSELGSTFGAHLDSEFSSISRVIGQIETNLALIQRDDGALANQVVHSNSFTSDALALMAGTSTGSTVDWRPLGAWLTSTAYAVGNIIETGSPKTAYVCSVAHTSGVFATDYAAGKWVVLSAPRTLVSADVTTALGFTPVNVAGDTMTGPLVAPTLSSIAGVSFTDTLVSSQDLGTINKGLYSAYSSTKADIVYGFASNVVRTSGSALTVGSQFTGYGGNGVSAGIFGGNTNAVAFAGCTSALIAHEMDVGSFNPNSTANKRGIDVVFKNRGDGQTQPGAYTYSIGGSTYSSAGSGLGSNYYNRSSVGVHIDSQQRTATGENCGWSVGVEFEEYSLDQSVEAAGIMPARGVDFSKLHYYGGADPTAAYRMDATISMRDLQAIWWNRDPASPLAANKVRTYFNPFTSRFVLMNGATERFGIDVVTGTIYSNGSAFTSVSTASNNTWTGTNDFNAAVSIGANLTFTGTQRRIKGDFSNATVANRTLFQTSTVNSATEVGLVPNGSSTTSGFYVLSDPTGVNGQVGRFAIDGTTCVLSSTALGAGAVIPLAFAVGASERARFNTGGALLIGTTSAPVTNSLLRVNGIIQCDNPVTFMVHRNGVVQAIASATLTAVAFTTKEFDTNTSYSTGTVRFTPPLGKYLLHACVTYQGIGAGFRASAIIYKNGAAVKASHSNSSGAANPLSANVSCVVDANGTDFFEVYTYQDSGVGRNVEGLATDTYFTGYRIG